MNNNENRITHKGTAPAIKPAGTALTWALRELLGALPERRDWLNPEAEAVLRAALTEPTPVAKLVADVAAELDAELAAHAVVATRQLTTDESAKLTDLITAAGGARQMLHIVATCASHDCEDCREHAGIHRDRLDAALAAEPTQEDRTVVLLRAAHALLKKQAFAGHVINVLSETVHYDGADCDGLCLISDIEDELGIDGEVRPA